MSRDIYCHICGEPVEIAELHYVAEDFNSTFGDVLEAFTADGCDALGGICNPVPDTRRAYVASIAAELMGDDVDGIASMMEDAGYMGMFE
jgi:hypothetical protein